MNQFAIRDPFFRCFDQLYQAQCSHTQAQLFPLQLLRYTQNCVKNKNACSIPVTLLGWKCVDRGTHQHDSLAPDTAINNHMSISTILSWQETDVQSSVHHTMDVCTPVISVICYSDWSLTVSVVHVLMLSIQAVLASTGHCSLRNLLSRQFLCFTMLSPQYANQNCTIFLELNCTAIFPRLFFCKFPKIPY